MALLDLDVGSAANANDGATLRQAFINTRKMFAEIYGATYPGDTTPLPSTATFQESVEDIVGAMFTSNSVSNITSTYTDNGTGAGKIDLSVAADITDINTAANSGLNGGVDSGDATLTLDLNNLAAAAVDVSADSIAIIDANDSNGTRKESIADLATAMAGTGLSATNGQLTASGSSYTVANQGNNRVVTSVDSTNGNAEANLTFDSSSNALNVTGTVTSSGNLIAAGDGSANGVTLKDGEIEIRRTTGGSDPAQIKFYCETNNQHAQTLKAQPHSAASSAVLTLPTLTGTLIGSGDSDTVTHSMIEGRYTAKASSSATGNQNLDCSAATTFLLTGNIATATLTLQNLKLGQVVDIVMSGTLSSADITLATNFSSATIRKVGSASLDTSTTNVIQVVCIDDDDSAALVHYSINTFATDTTP